MIREGDPDDAETAAIRAGLTIAKAPEERVELSAGTAPYTDDWRVEDIPIEEKFRQGAKTEIPHIETLRGCPIILGQPFELLQFLAGFCML